MLKDGIVRPFLYLAVYRRQLNKGTTIISKRLILIKLKKMTYFIVF